MTSQVLSEQLRRVAARTTKEIVLRRGESLGMHLGCGYPKSGTVWLCQLMSNYLALPYPRDYQAPIAMPSVIHAHWKYERRVPPTAYIVRDGRDVMVSLYFYSTRALSMAKNPHRAKRLTTLFDQLYGTGFDPNDVVSNLPRFIEHEFSEPQATQGLPWHEHVHDWQNRPGVVMLKYESLLEKTGPELGRVMAELTGNDADNERAELAARRFAFARSSGRTAGQEDRSSFLRKGVAGDWKNHFSSEAREVFQSCAGDALIQLGYETDQSWVLTP